MQIHPTHQEAGPRSVGSQNMIDYQSQECLGVGRKLAKTQIYWTRIVELEPKNCHLNQYSGRFEHTWIFKNQSLLLVVVSSLGSALPQVHIQLFLILQGSDHMSPPPESFQGLSKHGALPPHSKSYITVLHFLCPSSRHGRLSYCAYVYSRIVYLPQWECKLHNSKTWSFFHSCLRCTYERAWYVTGRFSINICGIKQTLI